MAAAQQSEIPHTLPTWVEENHNRFLSNATEQSPIILQLSAPKSVDKAATLGLQTEKFQGIEPPDQPPPADYFRNLANHRDVLASIIDTARAKAQYDPDSSGEGDKAKAQAQHEKFRQFINNVDKYNAYVTLVNASTVSVNNSEKDCKTLIASIVNIVKGGLLTPLLQYFADILENKLKQISDNVTSTLSSRTEVATTSYETVSLPASAVTTGEDPSTIICLSVVDLTRSTTPGKRGGTVDNKNFDVAYHTYRLKSAAIVAYADILAGSTITGVKALAKTFEC